MWQLVGGQMVWVPMAEQGEYGSEAGGGSGSAAEPSGESDDSGTAVGEEGDAGLPPDLDDWMTPDARAAFEYDPFAPKEEGAGEGEKGKSPVGDDAGGSDDPKAGSQSAKGKAQEEPEPDQERAAASKEETPEETVKRLEKQLVDYQNMMHQQLMDQAQRGSGEKKPEAKDGEEADDPLEKIPAYQPFKIPDAIKEKIFSEKPEDMMEGLGMMMQGVAQITHYNVRKEMAALMDERINKTVDHKQSELTEKQKAEQTQSQIKKDWEEHYPDLADKDLQPLVAHIGQQVVQETGAKEWNEKLRDQIAARVRKVLGRKEEKQEEEKPAERKPPYSAKGSARKGVPKEPNPVSQEISDTLGLF